ncbi:MAG: MIP/aquaporin family protein [Thermoplasmata archaeon]
MSWAPGQKLIAEFVGTFGLLLSVTGAAVFTFGLDVGDARFLLIALALGFGVIGMIYAFGDISGAHFNPAVTVGMWAAGRMKARDAVSYIVAQVLGGIVAVLVIAAIAYGSSIQWANAEATGIASQGYLGNSSPYLYPWGSVFVLEVAFTFLLVLVILMATRSENFSKNLAPLGIGLTLVMTNLVAIPIDGASINPARSFAPALISAVLWSGDKWAIEQNWIFWVAPVIGGLIAAVVDRVLRE